MSSLPRSPANWPALSEPLPGTCRRRADRKKPVIGLQGGAREPPNMLLPGKAGSAAAVRRTLATTNCRVADPTQVTRPRQLRDASMVMRFRPAHQSMINRRHDGRASCLAQPSLKKLLRAKPRIHAPATWKGGHESGENLSEESGGGGSTDRFMCQPCLCFNPAPVLNRLEWTDEMPAHLR